MLLPIDWSKVELSSPAACCSFIFNRHMRVVISFLINLLILSLCAYCRYSTKLSSSLWPWLPNFLPLTHLFISSLLSPLAYLDFWAQKQTGVADCCYFPALRVVRQHLQHLLSIYPKQLWYSNITTVHCMCVCVSVFRSWVWGWGLDFILIAGAAMEVGQTYVPRARNKSTDTLAFSQRWPFRRSLSQPLCLPLSFCLPACPRPSSSRALEFLLVSPNLPWLNVRITYFSAHTQGFN